MRYKSIFSVSFSAPDDQTARSIAQQHYGQMLDELRVEGADHPYEFALEHLTAQDGTTMRDVPEFEQQAI